MKPLRYTLIALTAACGFANAQTTATTTPVGYITHTVYHNTAEPGTPGLTMISPSLIEAAVFAGQSTVSPSGSDEITFSGGVPAGLDSSYVLEITAGPRQGYWVTCAATGSTSTTIKVNTVFPAGLPADTKVSVRKHTTLLSFLGYNNPGFTPFDGANTDFDEVQIINSANVPDQPITSFVYVKKEISKLPDDSWFYLSEPTVANDVVIEPGTSVLIKRPGTTTLTFTSVGTVQTNKTEFDIFPGLNFVGTHCAAGNDLDGMNFAAQLTNTFTGGNTDFDQLQFIRADGAKISPYVSLDPSLGAGVVMGDLELGVPAGTDPFKEGTGAILKRDTTKAGSLLILPGSTVSP